MTPRLASLSMNMSPYPCEEETETRFGTPYEPRLGGAATTSICCPSRCRA
jgi:hypothetical protein